MSAQLVVDLHRRAVGDEAKHQTFVGQKPQLVGERPAGNSGEHVLHFVEPSRARNVQGGKNFNGPTRSKNVQRFDRCFDFPFSVVRSLIGVFCKEASNRFSVLNGVVDAVLNG